LDKIISHHEIELIFSLELIDELVEVTQRPRFRKYFPIAYVQTLLEKLQARSTTIKVTSEIEI
jgi:predicted nucleic acid-binding protein